MASPEKKSTTTIKNQKQSVNVLDSHLDRKLSNENLIVKDTIAVYMCFGCFKLNASMADVIIIVQAAVLFIPYIYIYICFLYTIYNRRDI